MPVRALCQPRYVISHRERPSYEQSKTLRQNLLAALHDLTLAARYADHIVFLENGGLAMTGPTADVLQAPCLNRAYRIDSEVLKDRTGSAVIVAHRAVSN